MKKQNMLVVACMKTLEFSVNVNLFYDEKGHFKQKLLLWPQVPFKDSKLVWFFLLPKIHKWAHDVPGKPVISNAVTILKKYAHFYFITSNTSSESQMKH